jgi:D-arabinose 1-dehydrogenase-like Zn-dependent alcohol dehydrogenase
MDAVLTPWGALVGKGHVGAGDHVVVVGCGGLGSNAVQIATSFGAKVAVVDPQESQRRLGLDLGAEIAVDPSEVSRVETWSNGRGGADLVLETSGRRAGFDAAVAAAGPAGRIVCNGYQPGTEYGLDSGRLVLEEIAVMGSRVASRGQARDALEAVEDGRVKPKIMNSLPLSRLKEAISLLRAGEVEGRLVLRPGERDEAAVNINREEQVNR